MIPETIETAGKRRFVVGKKLCEGDIADFYGSTYANGAGHVAVVLKIARDRRDNDLLENEARILRALYPAGQGDEKFFRYLPRLIDTARLPDQRFVTIFPEMVNYITLAEVLTSYPKGIDFRDMAWMYKRLLSGLGFIGHMGFVHGAILPTHVFIHPEGHGAKIIGWSYALNFAEAIAEAKRKADEAQAAKNGPLHGSPKSPDPPKNAPSIWELLQQHNYDDTVAASPVNVLPQDPDKLYVKAMSVVHKAFYAPEILRKERPSPATDIYMAAKIVVALLGGNVETNQLPEIITTSKEITEKLAKEQIQAFLQASLLPAQNKRPRDAWELEEAFDELLRKLVGPRKYRPFVLPPKT